MAEQEMQNIKAGVEGGIGDVPSPVAAEAPSPSPEASPQNEEPIGEPPQSVIGGEMPSSQGQVASQGSPFDLQAAREQVTTLPQSNLDTNRIQELAEAIVNERWEDLMSKMGNLPAWKERTHVDLSGVKQEVMRLENRFEQLQQSVLGKVREYDEGVRSIHTEMKALEKVFERILEPLVSNIKELDRITKELKK